MPRIRHIILHCAGCRFPKPGNDQGARIDGSAVYYVPQTCTGDGPLASPQLPYPPSPQRVPSALLEWGEQSTGEVISVLVGLFLFAVVYIALIFAPLIVLVISVAVATVVPIALCGVRVAAVLLF